jgi:hypothetical protein
MFANSLCLWGAELKVQNFQSRSLSGRTEPIRLFIVLYFPAIGKDKLAVLQQRAAAQILTKTSII